MGNGSAAAGLIGTFWANVDFVDPHGGVPVNFMFLNGMRGGYDYRGGAFPVPYHTNINIGAAYSSQGPCVGCHMTSAKKHSFTVLSSASNGVISAIRSDLCTDCHGDIAAPITAADLNSKKDGYRAALTIITAQLAAKGIYYDRSKAPYFFNSADPAQHSPATRTVNWNLDATFQGANVMGAAFNLRLLDSDSGWVHNGTYSKRLLYDTVDYLDGGGQNNSVVVTIQNLDVDPGVKAAALAYITPRQ